MYQRRSLPLYLFIFGAFAGCVGTDIPVVYIRAADVAAAQLQSYTGHVVVQQGEPKTDLTVDKPMPLYIGNVVTTGPDGTSIIQFAGFNSLTLNANTSIVIGANGASGTEATVILVSGSVMAQGGGKNIILRVQTGLGEIAVGAEASKVLISSQDGISALVGTVTVVRGKQRVVIGANKNMSVRGLELALGGSVAGMDLQLGGQVDGMEIGLRQGLNGSNVRRLSYPVSAAESVAEELAPGQTAWRAMGKNAAVESGGRLRVNDLGKGTKVAFGNNSSITIDANSEVDFLEAQDIPADSNVAYVLGSGGLDAILDTHTGLSAQTLVAAGAPLKIAPSVHSAYVHAVATDGGAEVSVRSGTASLPDGRQIEAGLVALIQNGNIVGGLRQIPGFTVDVHTQVNTIVYHGRAVPGLRFIWSDAPTPTPRLIEVAYDADFQRLAAEERLLHGSLALQHLPAGKYFWRLDQDPATVTTVQIRPEVSNDCVNCRDVTYIDDTGEKTVVYFQKVLPAITLQWNAVRYAQKYKLQVFVDGEFDKPLTEIKSDALEHGFASGHFKEGKYYWLVTTLDAQDRVVSTGHINNLKIAHDNAIVAMSIQSPRADQKLRGRAILKGEVELGSRLSVNDKAVKVDGKGAFYDALPLPRGPSRLTFRSRSPAGVERVYIRDVVRVK